MQATKPSFKGGNVAWKRIRGLDRVEDAFVGPTENEVTCTEVRLNPPFPMSGSGARVPPGRVDLVLENPILGGGRRNLTLRTPQAVSLLRSERHAMANQRVVQRIENRVTRRRDRLLPTGRSAAEEPQPMLRTASAVKNLWADIHPI
jgi:hypothetical protein